MRLIVSKLYRAFPELDRFSDEQCELFVRAANRSWAWRLARWLVIALLAVGVVAAGMGVTAVAIGLSRVWNSVLGHLGSATALGAVLLVGFAALLVVRDRLLARRVRCLLNDRGRCFECGYSLLGTPVGSDLMVVCPECGSRVESDPAFNELVTDSRGVRVYEPRVPRESKEAVARRRKRRRAVLKWGGIGVATCAMLLASVVFGVWWHLERQAARARASRSAVKSIEALVRSVQPVAGDSPNRWGELVDVIKVISEATWVQKSPLECDSRVDGEVVVEFSSLYGDVSPAEYERNAGSRPGSYAATVDCSIECLEGLGSDGTLDRLHGVTTMEHVARRYALAEDEPFFAVTLEELGGLRTIARMNVARMKLALRKGDQQEYLHALEEALTCARILDRQGLLIDRLVATAMDALMFSHVRKDLALYPEATWFDRVVQVLDQRSGRVSIVHTLDVEEQGMLDCIRWMFSSPARVLKSTAIGPFEGKSRELDIALRPGETFAVCEAELKSVVSQWRTHAQNLEAGKPSAPPAGKARIALVDSFMVGVSRVFGSEHARNGEYVSLRLWLALERYHRAHGVYPDSLASVQDLLPPEACRDRLTGKPMEYTLMRDDATGKLRPVLGVDAEIERERQEREMRMSNAGRAK